METLLKADIFFFITTIAVVCMTLGFLVIVFFAIRLMRSLHDITELVYKETEQIKDDIDGARDTIKANAELVGTIIGAVARSGAQAFAGTRKKRSAKK